MAEIDNYWLRRKLSRRTAIRGSALAGVGAASFALVGCGDDDDDDDDDTNPTAPSGQTPGASPTTAVKQPVPGGELTFQISSPPPSLDPYTQTSFVNAYMNGLSYSKLYRFKAGVPEVSPADPSMETDLASAMPEQPNETTFVFKLKPNLKWHNVAPVNGRALTSEDIKYALDRYMTAPNSVHKGNYSWVDKVEAPDATTIRITSKACAARDTMTVPPNHC